MAQRGPERRFHRCQTDQSNFDRRLPHPSSSPRIFGPFQRTAHPKLSPSTPRVARPAESRPGLNLATLEEKPTRPATGLLSAICDHCMLLGTMFSPKVAPVG